jgi:hypothetical protein
MLDLEQGVRDIFQEAQSRYPFAGVAEMIVRVDGRDPTGHVLETRHAPTFRSPYRKRQARAYEARVNLEDRKARLLAGERPKLGGVGAPPTLWLRAAKELGIDLGITGKPCNRKRSADYRTRKIREALLRGERPSFKTRPPTAWLRIAKELGIDLRRTT